MIHEAVLESYRKYPEDIEAEIRKFSVTSISACPYRTYINFHRLDPEVSKGDPQKILNMKNGHWQEQEMIRDLQHAGYNLDYVDGDQLRVHVGKAETPGRIDGLIDIDKLWVLLEMKALNLHRYQDMVANRLDHEQGIRCQVQSYLESDELRGRGVERALIYFKHKDRNKPWSFFVDRDPDYIRPIIEMTDRIVMDGYEPEKEEIPRCANCPHRAFCWGETDIILDMSKFGMETMPEWVEKWKEGKVYRDLGKLMVEEAREAFHEVIGDEVRELLIGDLRVRNIMVPRMDMSKRLFIQKYGIEALPGIMEETSHLMMRVDQL